ncbi:uncharacterized protein LOC141703748 [Apium graveolens]|uniref:uncharacterized protein LOC141692551 n=1 Tax=Apium graveolens TaxID=4045 RepID=UPI003D7C058D
MHQWRLTGIYGEPNRANRTKTWDLLRHLARDSNLPWCVVGDLNNVMYVNDKVGGLPYPRWLIDGFNEALQDAGLIDGNITGHQFTWEWGAGTENWMEVRLDRALTSSLWMQCFPVAKLYNLEGAASNHSPIFFVPQQECKWNIPYKFYFENAWLLDPMCAQLVKDNWEGDSGLSIQQKVQLCGDKLALWGKEVTSNFSGRIRTLKEDLRRYRGKRDTEGLKRYNEASKKMALILNQWEVFWRQRAKQLWLQAGD